MRRRRSILLLFFFAPPNRRKYIFFIFYLELDWISLRPKRRFYGRRPKCRKNRVGGFKKIEPGPHHFGGARRTRSFDDMQNVRAGFAHLVNLRSICCGIWVPVWNPKILGIVWSPPSIFFLTEIQSSSYIIIGTLASVFHNSATWILFGHRK